VNCFIASSVIAAVCLVAAPRSFAQAPATATAPVNDDKHLVYADFEKVDDNKKPVSNRGGAIGLFPYQAPGSKEATFAGPELVHVKKDDPNHALKFDYSLFAPSDWTGVVLEIHGLPDADGKMVPDDVSAYKFLTFDCYATGIDIIRLEIISAGRGKDMATVYPQDTFKVRPGLNTYRVPLKAFTQPDWVKEERIDPKDVLKFLTSVKISAFCDQCVLPKQGMVIVDNIAFEK
jgi:hypothetical protein